MNHNFLRPIETVYKGYKFRSRLEARWAVLFDALGVKWQYEVEGFQLSDGECYLPDFKVRSINNLIYWYEVKPEGDMGDGKLQRFAEGFRQAFPDDRITDFTILSGDPYEVLGASLLFAAEPVQQASWFHQGHSVCPRCGGINNIPIAGYSEDQLYFQCFQCDMDTPCGSGNPVEDGLISPTTPHKGVLLIEETHLQSYVTKVKSSCDKARSYRFEDKR
jgi:hypothetical protein